MDFLSQGQLVTGTSKAWIGNVGELAKASHSHAAGDITSGTLSTSRLPTITVAKGGTGATTAAAARTNLGITLANLGAAASSHTHTKAQITDFPTTMTPAAHTHAASDVTSGTLPRSRGGLGKDASTIPEYAILRNCGANYDYIHYTATANGALYATATNGIPKFGTLPVAQGGTGVTSLSALKTAMNIQSIFKADTLLSVSGSQSWNDGESFTTLSDTSISSGMLAKYLALVISGTITVTNASYADDSYRVEATLGWKHCKSDDNTSSSQTSTYGTIILCNKSETTHNFSHIVLKHRETDPSSITFSIFNDTSGTANAAGFDTILKYKKYSSSYPYNFLRMNITYNDAASFDSSYDIKILGIYV